MYVDYGGDVLLRAALWSALRHHASRVALSRRFPFLLQRLQENSGARNDDNLSQVFCLPSLAGRRERFDDSVILRGSAT
jgi:hypothetical protein